MNRITVEAGITRLTTEIGQRNQKLTNLAEQLEGLTGEYEALTQRLDVHGEGVDADIDAAAARLADLRRQISDNEGAIADLQKRLKVTQQAMIVVENEENTQEYLDMANHAEMVQRRYNLAVVDLCEAHQEITNYRQNMRTLRKNVEDFARANSQPLPDLPGVITFESFRDGYLTVQEHYVRQKFPVE